MEHQKEKLIDIIESEYGLLDKLLKMKTMDYRQFEQFENESGRTKKNEMILDYIFHKRKHQDLITALSESRQTHVVNWIKGNGEYRDEFDRNWPLTENQNKILDDNQEVLVDILDTCELVSKLYSEEVINNRQRAFIDEQSISYKRNGALLGIVRRWSQKSYLVLIKCLRESNQGHIADILENGGAMVRIHATLDSDRLNEVETQIVNEVTNLLIHRNVSTEQANRVLSAAQLNIIAAKRGESIVLYVSCKKEAEFKHLCKIVDNSEIRNILEHLFNLLIHNMKIKVLSVVILNKDIAKARQSFKTIKSEDHILQRTENIMNNLPLELLDIILHKSYVIFIQRKRYAGHARDEQMIRHLAEVSYCWFKRIIERRFKKSVWTQMSGMYKTKNPFLLSIKSKQQFIEENLVLLATDKKQLKASDVLSDFESAIISRKSFIKKRQSTDNALGLSVVVNIGNEVRLDNFITYLRKARKMPMVKVIEKEGAVVRVEINSQNFKRAEWSQEFVKCLNALNDKINFRDREKKKLITKVEYDGIEFLKSIEDRDVVVWIWCKSTSAIEEIKKMNETNGLAQLFNQLSMKNFQFLNEKDVNIDDDKLRNVAIILFSRMIVEFMGTLDLKQVGYVYGVTKMRKKIYVLCRQKLIVFDAQNPFPLLETIEMEDIWYPRDVVSNEKENDLYILGQTGRTSYIWKNKQNDEIKHQFIKWLKLTGDFEPRTLFASDNDQLLMVNSYPSASLRIYDSDARLCLSISLNKPIETPIHAVETSTGNFVIVHRIWNPNFQRRELALSVLTRDGNIILNFNPDREEQRLMSEGEYHASYLCIDSEDRVFVADPVNGKVILVDSKLHWKQTIIPESEERDETKAGAFSQWPLKMFHDEEHKQLIVFGGKISYESVRIYCIL